MAHLVTVTDLNSQELLFNLDTAISFERGQNDQTIVTTRWGRTDIKETLSEIRDLAEKSSIHHQKIKNYASQ
jgi:hypothetical protein|tara:strand:- start:553 stop:768 length:216 start_codon:yes stop_codon:yes gene_type:complete